MLIVNQYKVIPIKDKNKKAQLDSLELNCSKVPGDQGDRSLISEKKINDLSLLSLHVTQGARNNV